MKGSRVETIEGARKEYKKLLEEGWKKTSIYNSYFQFKVGKSIYKVHNPSAPFSAPFST